MHKLELLLALLLLVAIALTPSLPQAQVLEPLCQCVCTVSIGNTAFNISVLIRPTGGDASLCPETDGLPCFTCSADGILSGCFAIYANPERAIVCPTIQRAPVPVPPPSQ
jgi:hypothetical protein